MDELSLILVIKIYVCSNSNLEGVEGSVAQTIIEEERALGVRDGFTKPIHSRTICLSFSHVGSFDVRATCWWEISNVCSSCLRDLPHTYSCTCFI